MGNSDSYSWPIPEYRLEHQPHFLFVVTQPYSGSTALSKLLATSHYISMLNQNGEGQWLIPGLCQANRWQPNLEINEESIRAVWLSEYQSQYKEDSSIKVIVEKSPPNMMRIDRIISLFDNYSLLALNRNPYAQCSSSLHRMKQAHCFTEKQRLHSLTTLIDDWIARSARLKSLITKFSMPLITYEAFCSSPNHLIKKLSLSDEIKTTIDPGEKIIVKDYPSAQIKNYNEHQIALLNNREIDLISTRLAEQSQLLDYYNYRFL